MSYVINKTNGGVLMSVQDGTTDTTTGLTLIGRDYPNYGELQNENFVRLLENFASDLPPGQSVGFAPIAGTLWWDTSTQRLKIYNGTDFIRVSPLIESATAPIASGTGDQWWDTTNDQLKSWTGSAWQLVGPLHSKSQGKSGPYVETLLDNTAVPHTVVTEYINGQVVYVSSKDTFILQTTTYGFSAIQEGINLPGNKVVDGNAYVGGLSTLKDDVVINGQLILARLTGTTPRAGAAVIPGTTDIYDIGSNSQQFRNIYAKGNLVLTDANISFANKSLIVQNKNYGGNVEVYVNSTSNGNVQAINVSGADGLIYVAANPTGNLGIATKIYTDTAVATVSTGWQSAIASTNANVAVLESQVNVGINSVITAINANVASINANDAATNDTLNNLIVTVTDNKNSADSNFGNVYTNIYSINGVLPTLAPLSDPALGGNPTAPTPPQFDNTTSIATTAFVTRSATALTTDYNSKINALTISTSANLTVGLSTKADINSPTFTGTPTATTPLSADNSTRLATTQFVTSAVNAQKFNYTVSTNSPTGGNDGDFWFQIG